MFPEREKAEEILAESEMLHPGIWVAHSRIVARAAETIARHCGGCCGLEEEKAYVLGLLHDIGKRFGSSQMRHIYMGYHYMLQMDYDEAARICLTHSFPCRDIYSYVGEFDVGREELDEMESVLAGVEFDDYDLLIQLCDGIAGAAGLMSLEERAADIQRRYGKYPEGKLERNREIKEYFENKMGYDLNIMINFMEAQNADRA